MKLALADRITQFTNLVTAGMEAWVQAGQLLTEMVSEDSSAISQITDQNPWMTFDVLDGFMRIGRKDIYPYLMLDQSPGARKLIELPYQYQQKYYDAEIVVATVWKGEIRTERKRLQELTKKEAEVAFCETGYRPIAEQRKLLRPQTHIREAIRNPREPEEPDLPDQGRGEEPEPETGTTDQYLAKAQACILAVRAELGDKNKPAFEKHITNALNAIGGLRFELTHLTP